MWWYNFGVFLYDMFTHNFNTVLSMDFAVEFFSLIVMLIIVDANLSIPWKQDYTLLVQHVVSVEMLTAKIID